MKAANRYLGLAFLASFLLGVISGLGSLSDLAYKVESQVLDHWFTIRYRLLGSQEVSQDLVFVGIDAKTLAYFGKPQLFWQSDLAKLITKIQDQSAKVVGVDIVINPFTKKLEQDGAIIKRIQDEGFELGMTSYSEVPVIFAEIYSEGTATEYQEIQDNLFSPYIKGLGLLERPEGPNQFLGLANIPTDADGSTRRIKVLRRLDAEGAPTKDVHNLSLRMLESATGTPVESQSEQESVQWRDTVVPYLFDESFLINYPGPLPDPAELAKSDSAETSTFPVISAADILEEKVDPEQLKDKIVLIAPIDSSMDDVKVIPGDPYYPGGGTHLSVLNMFLTDNFIARPNWLWVSVCVGFSLLGCAIGVSSGTRWLVVAVVTPVSTSLLGFLAFNLWLPAHFSTLALTLGALLGYLERLLTVEQERKRIRSTFGRMVSPQVMKYVLNNPDNLRQGQNQEITVLFSDINGFTTICEQHEPEELILMLSDYFSGMVDVIMKYDGYIKQYVGDEIMVIFGAPDKSEDHATKAIQAAIEMRKVLKEKKMAANGKPGFFEVKIGINTGSAVVGKVGPESRWEYAAVGDCVNLGARVMSKAKELGTDIGVSADSRERFEKEQSLPGSVPLHIPWVPYGVQSFKGKVSQMEVYGIADVSHE